MKLALAGLAILLVALLLAHTLGRLLPRTHTARASRTVRGSPPCVWDVITDVGRMSEWRTGVNRFEAMSGESGLPVWREHGRHRALIVRAVAWDPPRSLVTEVGAPGAPFSGTWTYSLEAGEAGTVVMITEDGEVPNPIFRLVGRFVLGWDATLRAYLDDLEIYLRARCVSPGPERPGVS